MPEVQLFSNGSYRLLVKAAGGGFSRWNSMAFTRWRKGASRDPSGLSSLSFEIDRKRFTGRGRSTSEPQALADGGAPSGSSGLFTDEYAVMAAWAVVEPVLAVHGVALPSHPPTETESR